jgi:hypothetical protein
VADDVDILGGAVGRIVLADNLAVLGSLPDDSIDLVYIDPPFNTGKRQTLRRLRTVRDEVAGDRTGFGGRRYRTIELGAQSYVDVHDDYLDFLEPRLVEIRRVLRPSGSLYLHLDPREVHYAKVLCDAIFGRDGFLNEVIWAYDYGARTKRRWPAKHDDILVYVKDPDRYWFDAEAGRTREGGARQAPDRHVVADDRAAWGRRADRLSDPEARCGAAAGGVGVVPGGGCGCGLLRGQRHSRRRRAGAGPTFPARRLEPGGGVGDDAPVWGSGGRRGGRRVGPPRRPEMRPHRRPVR